MIEMKFIAVVLLVACIVQGISAHGMMLEPAGRSSMWRFGFPVPPNYQDNQNFCGGYYVQNELNGGKCGVCGDPYDSPHPHENANTGLYGTGLIAKKYEPQEVINVGVSLTANHLGNFTYSLCVLPNVHEEEPESCFENLLLEDGSASYSVLEDDEIVINKVQLPNITCERCVLRWTYKCGNNWGMCDDGIWRPGCGPQEHFVSCSDISIVPSKPELGPDSESVPEAELEGDPESESEPEPTQKLKTYLKTKI